MAEVSQILNEVFMDTLKVPVHVEVELSPQSTLNYSDAEQQLARHFKSMPMFIDGNIEFNPTETISADILSAKVCDLNDQEVSYWKAELIFHCYRLIDAGPEKDFLDGEEDLPACDQWELPNKLLVNLWDTIVCDAEIKRTLLGYASTAMIFTNASVDADVVSWNRMILLHGPPGTGKTTLCKALAQKVFIRNGNAYGSGVLLEINSHSLFSKWFSESGKLVMKLFDHISEIAEDETVFVCVLIDEIESIASARQASVSSNEPSDAVRVVNAVLTSLDSLKLKRNVLVLCTSNMTSAIDKAFLDRVDLNMYIGPPPTLARYQILHSCLQELMDRSIICPAHNLLSDPRADHLECAVGEDEGDMETVGGGHLLDGKGSMGLDGVSFECRLWEVAKMCEGMSGRALRKLPLKAHAIFLQRPQVTLDQFLSALAATVQREARS